MHTHLQSKYAVPIRVPPCLLSGRFRQAQRLYRISYLKQADSCWSPLPPPDIDHNMFDQSSSTRVPRAQPAGAGEMPSSASKARRRCSPKPTTGPMREPAGEGRRLGAAKVRCDEETRIARGCKRSDGGKKSGRRRCRPSVYSGSIRCWDSQDTEPKISRACHFSRSHSPPGPHCDDL